jgi:hypothetical protein
MSSQPNLFRYQWPWLSTYPPWLTPVTLAVENFGTDTKLVDRQGTPIRVGDLLGTSQTPVYGFDYEDSPSAETISCRLVYVVYPDPNLGYAGRAFFNCERTRCWNKELLSSVTQDFTGYVVIGNINDTPAKLEMVESPSFKEIATAPERAARRAKRKANCEAELQKWRTQESINPQGV